MTTEVPKVTDMAQEQLEPKLQDSRLVDVLTGLSEREKEILATCEKSAKNVVIRFWTALRDDCGSTQQFPSRWANFIKEDTKVPFICHPGGVRELLPELYGITSTFAEDPTEGRDTLGETLDETYSKWSMSTSDIQSFCACSKASRGKY
eukprot:gb/GECG01014293.1/.p1 GENE.gb/GECG01014293.1/~~gb/GECG01014293.1/.p1  ORF type:complete len:149 (+),score=16.12 gb/GECG01014293.1/:1-447(+)